MWRYNFLDYLWLFHWLTVVHFRTSNAYNFLICERKHQVWVFIILVRTWGIFWYQNYLGLLKFFVFHLFNLLQYACIACRQDLMTSFVYNKKKFSNLFVKYVFYFTHEVKNMYISFVASPLMKYKYFHYTRWNKSHIQQKIWISSMYPLKNQSPLDCGQTDNADGRTSKHGSQYFHDKFDSSSELKYPDFLIWKRPISTTVNITVNCIDVSTHWARVLVPI